MTDLFRKLWANATEIEDPEKKKKRLALYERLLDDIDSLSDELQEMRDNFINGGPVTFATLQALEISTPGNPIGYPTGRNVVSFRLPDLGPLLVFKNICVAPKGKLGKFARHWHPDAVEYCYQWKKTGASNGEEKPVNSLTVFNPGEIHDYGLPPAGELLVAFAYEAPEEE